MDTLKIRSLETRLHLQPAQMGEEGRLSAALRNVLDGGLEMALERLGVPLHEEICIREIHAPVKLKLSATSSDLTVDWSLALAENLARVLRQGGAGVVHYPTPVHALVDFALGVAATDLSRAWAWRQMGLAEVQRGVTPAQAADCLVTALEREAHAIVPVLSRVAGQGALPALLQQLPARAWPRLAIRALDAAGAAIAWRDIERACASASDPPLPPERARIARALARSEIARAARRAWRQLGQSAASRQVMATLGVLEGDRGVLYGHPSEGARRVALAVDELGAVDVTTSSLGDPQATGQKASEQRRSGTENRLNSVAGTLQACTASTGASPLQTRQTPGAPAPHHLGIEPPGTPPGPEPVPEAAPPEEGLTGVERQRSFTDVGGLLFLLPGLADLNLPEDMATSVLGRRRTLPWILHQLAMILAEVQEQDAAALAFAGLGPEQEPPSRSEEPPSAAEMTQLHAWRRCLQLHLERHLPEGPDVLAWVCRRKAEIVADPGWIEVHLSLDEVSTEVRRAGLDLDPGYLPWLGVVFRFIYRQPW